MATQQMVLVVDGDTRDRTSTVLLLEAAGYQVRSARNFEDARAMLIAEHPDLLITDLRLGPYNGLHLVLWGRTEHPRDGHPRHQPHRRSRARSRSPAPACAIPASPRCRPANARRDYDPAGPPRRADNQECGCRGRLGNITFGRFEPNILGRPIPEWTSDGYWSSASPFHAWPTFVVPDESEASPGESPKKACKMRRWEIAILGAGARPSFWRLPGPSPAARKFDRHAGRPVDRLWARITRSTITSQNGTAAVNL